MAKDSITDFADKLLAVMPVVAREFSRKQKDEFTTGKITVPQFLVLEYLSRSGESKMTDLARFLSVTTAAMTGIVERLVRYGYISRLSDPQDRRIIKVRLTSKGSTRVESTACERRKMIINIFSKITQAERDDYLKVLLHIHQILNNQET